VHCLCTAAAGQKNMGKGDDQVMMARLVVSAISLAALSFSAAAQTAPVIAPDNAIVNILDGAEPGKVSVAGITVYGALEAGYFYANHGVRPSSNLYSGQEYLVSAKMSGSRSDPTNNTMGQSQFGMKGSQSLADLSGLDNLKGWSLGFDLQIGFDPIYGVIADACKTLTHNNGVATLQQSAAADGSRCGQIFNGEAYGSLKNDVLGELRFGRQNTLLLTTLAAYDPNPGSYGYSLFGYSGSFGGGYGLTENARWNNAFKYTNTIGPVRVGAMYRFDGDGLGGNGYGFSAGIDVPGALKGLSIDGTWGRINSSNGAAALSAPNCGALGLSLGACQNSNFLNGTISDNEAWALAAKYKFGDAAVMGGYQRIMYNNTSARLTDLNIIGGYVLNPLTINYNRYLTERDLDIWWVGGKYAFTPKLTGTAAYYHIDQNSFLAGTGAGPTSAGTACNGKSGVSASSNCAGQVDFYSVNLDYQATKRLDLYGGVTWTDAKDGLSSGFTVTNNYIITGGTRFRF
jgi:predicted porin